MEKSLQIIGVTREELQATITLALMLLHLDGVMWWGNVEVKRSDDFDEINCELVFSKHHSKACANPLPVLISADALTDICWNWLGRFKPNGKAALGGDGSVGAGWALETGRWASDFSLKLKFQTMYYGK